MKFVALLAATAASVLAVPAVAQDNRDPSRDFDGPYISIGGGATLQGNDRGETLVFDTDRDGTYGDTVNTAGGTNAFSPGFCNGAATSTANVGCRNDKDGPEFFGRLGYDKRMGNFVLGAVVEGGHSVARDSVSGFSTTPASYTMSREADYQANARLRAGYTPGGGALFYVTGGGAYARLDNRFTTTNTANSFADNGKTNAWGYTVGGGAELMVTNNIGIGLEYLYTDVKDKDYVVNVGPGSAPATNPFLLNGGGTDIRRSDPHFRTHSVRGTLSYRF
ncbi:outer membrane protein [Sphingopyxis alaskensis]|jgi:outer membrane immunogenic protein|uniref:Membrane protein n=1 Tax=Sphingopyxis alaskensis (strain DSM 13593 / LMG 18877 / RB2256) TaxID=317655 RepID=Q1GU63_SPHAL|nr:outer membrane beta-barrel protein [Sphingopyxis alaskensis]ABF52809.1 membrane protein [Sphingopyxis alaskensis RB2256]MCM3418343.1 outer membrane beta-barrel protein [Sphingopyxis alaskensis]